MLVLLPMLYVTNLVPIRCSLANEPVTRVAGSVPGVVFLAGDSIELFSGVGVNTIFGFMKSVLSIGAKWSEGVVEFPAAGAVL